MKHRTTAESYNRTILRAFRAAAEYNDATLWCSVNGERSYQEIAARQAAAKERFSRLMREARRQWKELYGDAQFVID